MRKIKLVDLVVPVFFCIFSLVSTHAFSSDSIKWHTYEEGVEFGKKNQKKVFLYFYSDSCGYCEAMETITFKDISVIDILNKNFISVKVNTDKERKTTSIYNIRGLPSNLFIAEKGEIIRNLPGYIPPDMFSFILKYIYTDSYKAMTLKSYLKSLMFSGEKQL